MVSISTHDHSRLLLRILTYPFSMDTWTNIKQGGSGISRSGIHTMTLVMGNGRHQEITLHANVYVRGKLVDTSIPDG